MKQPGIVKKLQVFLITSLILNLALGQEIILSRLKKPVEVELQEQGLEQEARSQVTEEELKAFVTSYLKAFFRTNQESINFLADKTNEELFILQVKPEIIKRKGLALDSSFELDDIYLDSLDSQHAKAITLGRELFGGSYIDRNLTIELVINTMELKVEAIPLFKVQ